MSDECELRAAVGIEHVCEGEDCPYWRVLEHIEVVDGQEEGCAIQYFELLDGGEGVARWLHSVRARLLGLGVSDDGRGSASDG